ncbi:hypothetical protein Rrhod_0869 [Rhodococcus rhodnii LMG 5362]|uniref:Uncharacterized protein n=1 Tax=Rhodococcus rhodnii LMG 5362 TaxID=1273125 RepID=R7WR81_9NOCA|nr:hypothetical protein Rrhod_0869 [Rhodococcus rhodnii LMG 5362]
MFSEHTGWVFVRISALERLQSTNLRHEFRFTPEGLQLTPATVPY